MTKLQRKRYDAVVKAMKMYAIMHNDRYLISLWDLAWNLNNIWEAYLFVTNFDKIEYSTYNDMNCFAVKGYQVGKLINGIRHGIKNTLIKNIVGKNHNEYLVTMQLDI